MSNRRLKNEVEYRLARWLLLGLYQSNKLTENEYESLLQELLMQLDPLTKSIEVGGLADAKSEEN